MALNAKSLGIAGGILWGGMIFLKTIACVYTGYASAFLEMMTGIYPG